MSGFAVVLVLATFSCGLLAGVLFAFAVVVMPGLATLGDAAFLRAFQVIDRVIQNNQPLFLLVWLGSGFSLLGAAALGFRQLDTTGQGLLSCAVLLYVLGVQVPTIAINIPLNDRVQALDLGARDPLDRSGDDALTVARADFERRWNRWNVLRTIMASLVVILLLFLVVRL